VESEEGSKLCAVGGVLVDSELDVLGELLVEDLEVVLVLGDGVEHFKSTLDDVLADQLDDTVLLKVFTGDVEWKIIRIDNTLEEVEVFWDEIFAVVHDKDTADIELDVVELLLWLKEIKEGERCFCSRTASLCALFR